MERHTSTRTDPDLPLHTGPHRSAKVAQAYVSTGGPLWTRVRTFLRQFYSSPLRILGTLALISVLGCVYYWALLRWGSFAPPLALIYTTRYKGASPGAPPADWRPYFRVVLTLSTLPHHLEYLEPTFQSLLGQSLKADAIYLNLPRGLNKRLNVSYPETFETLPGITVNRCEDYGPLTKLYPALELESNDNTLIITVDDDKIYSPDAIRYLAWHAHHSPNVAFGVCGWAFMWVPPPMGVVPIYVPFFMRGGGGTYVDVLQACCGNAYRRGFFTSLPQLSKPPQDCWTTDDLWIAGYLAAFANVRRVIIPDRQEPDQPSWKATEPTQWRLSTVNSRNMNDIKCITAVEQRFSKTWPTASSY
eukprot:TRINITY_DN5576_c0_g1_i1.p1 TRINITY_DN5576_c0_g1~~TRINITY_DN5576_c0_g1_i1.p1  ORF type:complete len:360 (+),score=23.43 TRINITY_DN5576_c0_g1_i1:1-1080(+)